MFVALAALPFWTVRDAQEFPLIARRRSSRSRSVQPRRSAAPFSVTITPASLRGVATGPESCFTTRLEGRQISATPARRLVGGADEVERAADRADVAAARQLAVHLAGEVDLDRRVDGDEALELGQHRGAVGVVGGMQAHLGVLARPIEELLRAHEAAAMDLAGQGALRVQRGDAVRDQAGMKAQPAPLAQRAEHGVRHVPMPHSSTARSGMYFAAWRAMAVSISPERYGR